MPNSIITKKILAEALKSLMQTTPFAKVSIGDIVKLCSMNRNSFYYHFKDKYELLNWIFLTEITEEINRHDLTEMTRWEFVECICAYFYSNKTFYINAMDYDGQNSFIEYLRELFQVVLLTRSWAQADEEDLETQQFTMDFFLDAIIGTLARWLREGAQYPPDVFTAKLKHSLTLIAASMLEEL